jgi:hypothetical protein
MTHRRMHGIAALLLTSALALGGCAAGAAQAGSPGAPHQAATLQEGTDGAPGTVTLSEAAHGRLAIKTAEVTASGGALAVPYAAVVYEPDGSAWAYVETEPLHYQRQEIAVQNVVGNQATLTSGPPAGTRVVVQGAAELVGVETGIDGEE